MAIICAILINVVLFLSIYFSIQYARYLKVLRDVFTLTIDDGHGYKVYESRQFTVLIIGYDIHVINKFTQRDYVELSWLKRSLINKLILL